ncbi:HD-GYP domain-containing protein [Paenibacillus thalictri]|uniref:HD-GYP domain-containing protein n=2 Tax=Paenibacillus thalictri TaxID=2527873 RepID=A0A4V2J3T5_9BACL|nr:HD-GYP domain-containing protein [Paenibacillus thalictri]
MEKDSDTYDHSVRVSSMAKLVAAELKLNQRETFQLVNGCLLHDVGKLRVPLEILQKPSALEPHEWDLMRLHPIIGAKLLHQKSFVDEVIIGIVTYHHERWDGKGYPYGLRGDSIPIFARICAIIDSFDSMVSKRPYHKGLSVNEAMEQLTQNAGTQFDKDYVRLFIRLFDPMSLRSESL